MATTRLTRVAVLEVIPGKDGAPADVKVLVKPEDKLITGNVRETALIEHASKLVGKNPATIEVVCSDFTAK